MKIRILFLLSSASGVPYLLPAAIDETSTSVPEKLRLYQSVTRISDEKLFSIFKRSLEGKFCYDHFLLG